MKTGVEKIIQAKGGDAPAKNQTGVQKIIELLGGDPPGPNQTGVDKIVEILENGGGNPNSVQTITGTLAEPWGDVDTDLLYEAILHGNASADIVLDLSSVVEGLSIKGAALSNLENGRECINFSYLDSGNQTVDGYPDAIGFIAGYNKSMIDDEPFQPNRIILYSWETGFINAAFDIGLSNIPTTLTIIWHPLPT